jgi:3-oxoacyl-[acyl-carrier-protein] synthase-1
MTRPVFIAGRGAVSGFGSGLAVLVEGVFAGRRALRARARTAAHRGATRVAAEFPSDCFGDAREVDLPFLAAVCAAREALREAGNESADVALVFATTKGELSGLVDEGTSFGLPARLAARVAAELGVQRVLASVSTACTSGLSALALAERRIAAGEAERVLVVGVDALSEFILAGFGAMLLLDPEPCRPFDVGRTGMSLGEGAGAIVLTAHAHESLGVRIAGYAGANDARHVTGCDREGRGVALATRRALAAAGLACDAIDLVHLHGTGTRANDASEAFGLVHAFGGRTPPAFGSKAQLGHTLGAAGLLESLVVLEALERGAVPANVGLVEPGVDPALALVREPETLPRSRRALKVASGFGGIQQAMIFER